MTLQPDPPQDLLKFLSITDALNDYDLTEREISALAYQKKIKLYFYWYGEFKAFPFDEIKEYLTFCKITVGINSTKIKGSWVVDTSKGSLVYEEKSSSSTEEDYIYTKENIFINIPELEAAFSKEDRIDVKKLPPLLRIATECRQELFTGEFEFDIQLDSKPKEYIERWLGWSYPGLDYEDYKKLCTHIQPDKYKTGRTFTSNYKGAKASKEFKAEEYDLAIKIIKSDEKLSDYKNRKTLYKRLKRILDAYIEVGEKRIKPDGWWTGDPANICH